MTWHNPRDTRPKRRRMGYRGPTSRRRPRRSAPGTVPFVCPDLLVQATRIGRCCRSGEVASWCASFFPIEAVDCRGRRSWCPAPAAFRAVGVEAKRRCPMPHARGDSLHAGHLAASPVVWAFPQEPARSHPGIRGKIDRPKTSQHYKWPADTKCEDVCRISLRRNLRPPYSLRCCRPGQRLVPPAAYSSRRAWQEPDRRESSHLTRAAHAPGCPCPP